MSGPLLWLTYLLIVGSMFSAVILLLTAVTLWRRRHTWRQLALWWSAASLVAALWSLSVALGFILSPVWAVRVVHVGRLLASWTTWMLMAALGALLFPENRFWVWTNLTGMALSFVVWLFYPYAYDLVFVGSGPLRPHLVLYQASPISMILDGLALFSALVIVVLRGRLMMGNRFMLAGFLVVLILSLVLVGLYLLGFPAPWNWLTGVLWILGLYIIWSTRQQGLSPLIGYPLLLARLPEGVALVDGNLRILWFNPAFERLWPWPFRPHLPLDLRALPPQTRNTLAQTPPDHPQEWEEHVETPQGPRHLRLRSVPLRLSGRGLARVLYVDDVTLRREAQARLQRYLQQIRLLNEMLESIMSPTLEDEAERLRKTLQVFLQGWRGFPVQAVALYAFDEESRAFRLGLVLGMLRQWLRPTLPEAEVLERLQQPVQEAGWCLATSEEVPLEGYALPLRAGDRWLGFLWMALPRGHSLDEDARNFLSQSTQLLAQALYLHAVIQQRRWLMRVFLNAQTALLVLTWPEGRLLLANPQAHAWGLPQWLATFWASEAADRWRQALAAGQPVEDRLTVNLQGQPHRMWALAIPLALEEETGADGQPQGLQFTLWLFQDISHIEALVEQLQRQTAFVEDLLRLSQSILSGGMRMTDMLRRILKTTADIVNAEAGTLILVDERQQPYATFTGQELYPPTEFTYRALESGIAGWALKNRAGLLVEDTLKDPRWVQGGRFAWRSVLCVPLYYRDTPLAVLTLTHREPNHFTQEDLRLLEAAADVTALALYTVRLYEEQYYLTRQAREAREEARALLRQRQMLMANLGQALTPLVEDLRSVLRTLEARVPEDAQPWMDRLWEAWLELYRLSWALSAARVPYRKFRPTLVRMEALLERLQETLAPWLQHHSLCLTITRVDESLDFRTDEYHLFYALLLLLYFSLKLARQDLAFLAVETEGDQVVIRLDAPAPGMEREERQSLTKALNQRLEATVLTMHVPGTGLPLLATLLRNLQAQVEMHDTPEGRFLVTIRLPRNPAQQVMEGPQGFQMAV